MGKPALSTLEHAGNLKKELQEVLEYSDAKDQKGNLAVDRNIPHGIFKTLSDSILALLDKVLDQPSLKDILEAIGDIDQNTKTILTKVEASKHAPSSFSLTKAVAPVEIPLRPDKLEAPSESLHLPAAFTQVLNGLQPMHTGIAQQNMVGKEKTMANALKSEPASQATMATVGVPIKVTAHSSEHKAVSNSQAAGATSRIVLESSFTGHGNAHGRIYNSLEEANREIRLVKISVDPDPHYDIQCEIIYSVSLDTCPAYKALSYT